MSAPAISPLDLHAAGKELCEAANNALELLELSGHSAAQGDTADDLRTAVGNFEQALSNFIVTVRTTASATHYRTAAASSFDAFMKACEQHCDMPCGISVAPAPITPAPALTDRSALEQARLQLRTSMPLDDMLKVPALAATLNAVVATQKKPRRQRIQRFDWRKAQANDHD
jgi:hypothetical protein